MLGSWKTPDKKTEIQKREELLKNSIQNPNYKVQLASGEGKRRILLGVCRKATLMPSVTLKKKIKRKPFNDSQLFVMLFSVLFYGLKMFPIYKNILWCSGFPGGTVVKNPPANAGNTRDEGLIPGWERSHGGGNGNPLQYSCQEWAWRATVHGVTKSWTWLSN